MRIHSEAITKEPTLKKQQIAIGVAVVLGLGGIVYAQQSEFQGKIQEDLDGYKNQFISNCGSAKTVRIRVRSIERRDSTSSRCATPMT